MMPPPTITNSLIALGTVLMVIPLMFYCLNKVFAAWESHLAKKYAGTRNMEQLATMSLGATVATFGAFALLVGIIFKVVE